MENETFHQVKEFVSICKFIFSYHRFLFYHKKSVHVIPTIKVIKNHAKTIQFNIRIVSVVSHRIT